MPRQPRLDVPGTLHHLMGRGIEGSNIFQDEEDRKAGKGLGPRPKLVGGGLIRSLGGWSSVLSLRKQDEAEAYDERILGGGDFVQAVLKEADQKLARQIRARKKTGSLARIIRERCRESGVNERELKSGRRRRAVSELRRSLCVYLYRELRIPLAEIARQVGVGTT